MVSSGRKRPADQMSMSMSNNTDSTGGLGLDAGGGSSTNTSTTKKTRSGRKKKDKRSKKAKEDATHANGSTSGSSAKDGSSLEVTATAEGKQMAQVLSTFSKLEQSRFEAFRKAAFPGDAIARFVAHCLIYEQHRPLSGSIGAGGADAGSSSSSSAIPNHHRSHTHPPGTAAVRDAARFRHLRPVGGASRRPVLSEVVAPGQAGDITVVVSTLAKEYAQRLVLEARKHATERRRRRRNERDDDEHDESGDDDDPATAPGDILGAFAHREARGLDPGFFLQAPRDCRTKGGGGTNVNVSAVLADPDTHRRQDLARSFVLAAQQAYDEEQMQQSQQESSQPQEPQAAPAHGGDEPAGAEHGEESASMEVESEGDNDNHSTTDDAWDDDDRDRGDDPSEMAVRLFAKHVNRMIARQHGITVVTSDSDDDDVEREHGEPKPRGDTPPTETEPHSEEAPASKGSAESETNEDSPNSNNNDGNNKSEEAAAAAVVPMDISTDAVTPAPSS